MFIKYKDYREKFNSLVDNNPEMSGVNPPVEASQALMLARNEYFSLLESSDSVEDKKLIKESKRRYNDQSKSLRDILKKHYNQMVNKMGTVSDGGNKNIIEIDTKEDLIEFINYLINLSYYPTEDVLMWDIRDYFSPCLAEKALLEEDFVRKQNHMAGLISTHNVKMINTEFSSVQYTFKDAVPKSGDYISSADIKPVKSFDFVGGGPDAKICQLMYTEFKYKNRLTGIFGALSGNDDELLACLFEMGEAYEAFFKNVQKTLSHHVNRGKEAADLQILVPVSDSDYVALTPIVNVGFSRIFHDKLLGFKDQNPDSFVLTDVFKVGGTQPINAGKYNVSQSGYNRTLKALYPTFEQDKHEWIINQFKYKKTLINGRLIENVDFLKMPLEFSKQKDGFKRYLPLIISPCLNNVRYAKNIWEKGYLEGIEPRSLNAYERNLIMGDSLSANEVEECARHFINIFLGQIDSDAKLLIGNEERRPYLIAAMRELISEF